MNIKRIYEKFAIIYFSNVDMIYRTFQHVIFSSFFRKIQRIRWLCMTNLIIDVTIEILGII